MMDPSEECSPPLRLQDFGYPYYVPRIESVEPEGWVGCGNVEWVSGIGE